ncbi:hypothetical protein Fmac_028526 [Flemingia macrophylla]|uniref:Uncharacterized protein n=1 Tax=Flemingia macrophylla TaxID=520843 RepID=A0ABD1L7R6_9FABA
MTTILVYVFLRSNLEWMRILRLMLQIPTVDHPSSKDKALDREDDTSAETRKLEGKLDALVNLVNQLVVNQKLASIARVCGIRSSNDHHPSVYPSSQQSGVDEHPEAYFSARNDAIAIRRVHEVPTEKSAETRKLEGKLDALMNLVTQLTSNQKPGSFARVCDIRYFNDHHTNVCPSSDQSGFSARNDAIVIRGGHDVAIDTSAETRKLEGKLDALVILVTQLAANQKPASVARVCSIRSSNDHHTSLEGKLDALVKLVTKLAANQKPASIARVCGIRSSNDHHTSVCPSSQQSGVDEHPERLRLQTPIADHHSRVHDGATDTSAKTRKLEGKLDALVNLVTQLSANQKSASVA